MIDLKRPALEARDQLAAGLEPLDTLLLDHDTLLMPSAFLTADGLTSSCSFSLHATTVIPWMMALEGFAAFTTVPAAHHNQSSPQGSPLSDEAPAVTAPTPTTHP